MFSLWFVLAFLMADVMGHGGDGAGDPPPPGGDGFWRNHQQDGAPVRKTRGAGKNLKLERLVKKAGGPLDIVFDEEATFMPVGELGKLFSREVGLYMWRTIPLDKEGWQNVEEAYKNALYEHINENFNLKAVEEDLEASRKKKGGINHVIQNRYSGRKHEAKEKFMKRGGYENIEEATANVLDDMIPENREKAIKHFCSLEHRRKSEINAACRQKQAFTYRGGTRSYATTCYNKNVEREEAYRLGHTDRDGNFDSPQNQENHRKIVEEVALQTKRLADEGTSARVDRVPIFEKVLGTRRGHTRGIGPKPCARDMNFTPTANQTSAPPQFTPEQISALFQNEAFVSQFNTLVTKSIKASNVGGEEDEENENDDNEPSL